jgi:PKD repeat protein
VIDGQGASEISQQTVTVRATDQPISVTFAPTVAIAGRPTTYTAAATAATNHRIVSYEWTWGDGTSSTTVSARIDHTFNAAGSYLVRLTVRDDLGQTSTATQVVAVSTGLVADFSNSPAIAGRDTTFDASRSFSEAGSVQLYTWSWGDGSNDQSTASATSSHKFDTEGSFDVTLTVSDSQGRTATLTRSITVVPAP